MSLSKTILAMVFVLMMGHNYAWPDEPMVRVDKWSCLMTDQAVVLRFLDQREDRSGNVSWTISKGHRTIAKGRAVSSDNDEMLVKFTVSDMQVGSVVKLELKLKFDDGALSESLFLLPTNPFARRQEFLEQAKLRLFDPSGETAELFESSSIPFERLRTLESVDVIEDGLLIVGEGNSLDRYSSLVESASKLATRGATVIFLAPLDGGSKAPKLDMAVGPQRRIVIEGAGVIKQFDKRFDTDVWAGQESLRWPWQISQDGETFSLSRAEAATGWHWIQMEYRRATNHQPEDDRKQQAGAESSVIFCGLGIVDQWDEGPVPRHLLWKMIEKYSTNKNKIDN